MSTCALFQSEVYRSNSLLQDCRREETVMGSDRALGGVFISYRREETAGWAGRLYDRLSARFGEDHVFMDVDSITRGADFTEKLMGDLSACNVLLALIGQNWSAITDSKGKRRLDNPDDWVRVEIEIALQRGIEVIPVLVDGAVVPQADRLPPNLRPFARRQACELRHTSFQADVKRLINDISAVITRAQQYRRTATSIHAPAVDVAALAEALRLWYENQSLEASTIAIPDGVMVQCRTRRTWKRASDTNALLRVILRAEGEDLLVEIGSAKWVGKTYVFKYGLNMIPFYIPIPASIVGPSAREGSIGMWTGRWRQYRLADQTISFLRDTAPRHARST